MPFERVALIGLMATGKSTLGRELARHLDWPFVDVDDVIRDATGSTVRQIWEREGEEGYRPLETAAVLDALGSLGPAVVAVPAGAVMDAAVVAALAEELVFVVWMAAAPETSASRVRPGDHRPLLGADPLAVLTQMATDREDRYRSLADATIVVDGLFVEDVVHQGIVLVDAALARPAAGPPPPTRSSPAAGEQP